MGKFRQAAHRAARTLELQEGLVECIVPANAIVVEFLL